MRFDACREEYKWFIDPTVAIAVNHKTDSPNCSLTVSLPVKHLSQPPPSVGAQIDDQLFPSGFPLNCEITLSKFIRRFQMQDNIKKFRFNEQSFKWQQEITAGKYCSSDLDQVNSLSGKSANSIAGIFLSFLSAVSSTLLEFLEQAHNSVSRVRVGQAGLQVKKMQAFQRFPLAEEGDRRR